METLDVGSMTGCVSVRVFQNSKMWGWYLDYLFTQGYDGLKHFVQGNISWKSAPADIQQSDSLSASTVEVHAQLS